MRHRAACLLAIFISCVALSAQTPQKSDRLASKDANHDGKLSRQELGETFWQRAAGHDANGDGLLDEKELAAFLGKGRREKVRQERPGGANTNFEVREFKGSNGHSIRYSLFVALPADPSSRLPLVLCLHGAGGNVEAANLLASPEMQKKYPCIVLAPGCDGKSTRWAQSEFRGGADTRAVMPEMMEMLDAVAAETKADRTRFYILGQSMGGVGTWGAIAAHASKFAAALPICGMWEPTDAPKMNGVAIWAFHGDQDNAVPVSGSRDMIAALKRAGVKPEPKFTELPGVGHGSWGPAYAMSELWDWLFAQRRLAP